MKPSLVAVLLSLLTACSSEFRATGTELLAEAMIARCQRLVDCGAAEPVDVPHCVVSYLDLHCAGNEERCTAWYALDAIEWGYCVDGYGQQICHAAADCTIPTPCRPFASMLGL